MPSQAQPAFQPQTPFPKSRGDTIRSADWNDLVVEVQRLGSSKVNRTGDTVSGPLSVAGTMGIGTFADPDLSLRMQSPTADRAPLIALATPNNEDFISISGGRRGEQLPFIAWKRGDLRIGTATGANGSGFLEVLRINGSATAQARLEMNGQLRAGESLIGTMQSIYVWTDTNQQEISRYAVFGASSLDQTRFQNYALAQFGAAELTQGDLPGARNVAESNSLAGLTCLNSPIQISVRIGDRQKLSISDTTIEVSHSSALGFGSQTRQMINLWGRGYGIGVQSSTQYYRSDAHFAWFKGGSHNDRQLDPGGGVRLMALNSAGDLILSARTNPSADPKGSLCRALVDLGNTLSINHGGDYANGVVMGGNLTVNGNAFKPGGGSWGSSSDRRLKQNIEPLDGALDRMLRLRGVQFEWREPERQGNLTSLQMGLIAQEVEDIFPDWVENDADGYKVLTIRGFEALTVEALRELKTDNDNLRLRVQQLEQQLAQVAAQGNMTQRTNGNH